MLVWASVVMASAPAPPNPEPACPCAPAVNNTNLPEAYGIGCAAHDLNGTQYSECTSALPPQWCSRAWCYVDRKQCGLHHQLTWDLDDPGACAPPTIVLHHTMPSASLPHISPAKLNDNRCTALAVTQSLGDAYVQFVRSYAACGSLPANLYGKGISIVNRTRGKVLRAVRFADTGGWTGRCHTKCLSRSSIVARGFPDV